MLLDIRLCPSADCSLPRLHAHPLPGSCHHRRCNRQSPSCRPSILRSVSSVLRLRAPHPLHATLKPAFTIRKLARNPFAVSRLCHPSFTAGRTRFVELPQVHMSLVSCDGVAADAVCPPTMFEWYAPRIQMLITTKFQFQTRSTHHLPDAQLQVDQHVAVCASPRMDISRHRCQHQHLRRCLQRLAPHTDSRRHTDLVWTSGTRLVECGLQVLTSPRFAFFAPNSFLGLCSTTAATATAAPSQPFSHSRATVQPLTRTPGLMQSCLRWWRGLCLQLPKRLQLVCHPSIPQ